MGLKIKNLSDLADPDNAKAALYSVKLLYLENFVYP